MYRNSGKKICAIILAAGNSKRFGENKLLYSVDGTPMLTHIAECMLMMKKEGFLRTVLCVTRPGPTEDLIGSTLPVVLNTHPEQGISLSIRLGLEKLHKNLLPFIRILSVLKVENILLGRKICSIHTVNVRKPTAW